MASDDLRTRIIAAIARADQDWCSDRPLHEDMADAVIRELGLHQEVKYPGRFSFMPPQRHRYVTEWETDA